MSKHKAGSKHAKAKAKAKPKPKAMPTPKAKGKAKVKTASKSKSKPVHKAKAKAKAKVKAIAKPKAKAGSKTKLVGFARLAATDPAKLAQIAGAAGRKAQALHGKRIRWSKTAARAFASSGGRAAQRQYKRTGQHPLGRTAPARVAARVAKALVTPAELFVEETAPVIETAGAVDDHGTE